MVSPWMGNGHALEYVQANPETDCVRLLAQAASGLLYLHTFEPPVIHGDLKGSNILISESGVACIADFGLSELRAEGQADPKYSTPWYAAGNPRWQAPELVKAETKEQARRTMETDTFAFGRVMAELFTKNVPFSYIEQEIRVAILVINGSLPERPCDQAIIDAGLNDNMWELMKSCWDVEPAQRPSAKGIYSHLRGALEIRSAQEIGSCHPSLSQSPRPTKRVKVSEGVGR